MKKNIRVKRATSYDVAKLAGVSQTTVSFVLNGNAVGISEETQARVREAMTELNFHPHEAARRLAKRASRTLGFIIPEIGNAHYQDMVLGAKEFAQRHNYSVLLRISDFREEEERAGLQMLTQQQVDAIIIALWSGDALFTELRTLFQQDYPIVCMTSCDDVDTVIVEPRSGERQIIEHLAALGHRRIGYIYGVADQQVFSTRLHYCLAFQQEMGIPVEEQWVYRCGPTLEDGYRACRELLMNSTDEQRPTALVVVNDLLSSSVYGAIHDAHLRIPQDISVVSFDNTPLASYMIPPLTTVDGETQQRGAFAAHLAVERIADPKRPVQHIETQARLIRRASTGPIST